MLIRVTSIKNTKAFGINFLKNLIEMVVATFLKGSLMLGCI